MSRILGPDRTGFVLRGQRQMQRGTSVAFAMLFVAAVAVVVLGARAPAPASTPVAPAAESAPAAVDEPRPEAGAQPPASADSGPPPAGEAADDAGVELPPGAPKTVGFGVVLVTYAGVQLAPEKPRTKAQALALAKELLETARKDFGQAVKKGDRGSTDDAGQIPRGVLEPAIEHVLFTLPKGEVHDEPLDTPRGYWIVRRNE